MLNVQVILLAFCLTLCVADETTDNLIDIDDTPDLEPGKAGNYHLIVHLHRPLRLNVFGKKVDGKLSVKVDVKGKEFSQTIDLKEGLGLAGNMVIKRTKMDIVGEIDDSSTASISFDGEGSGVLQVTRLALIPTDKGRIENARNAKCANFRGNNLLELKGTIEKNLSRRACLGVPGGLLGGS